LLSRGRRGGRGVSALLDGALLIVKLVWIRFLSAALCLF
jgi:hypothetical protein